MSSPAPDPARRDTGDLPLAEILRRCADGDADGLRDLEAVIGERVRTVLTRALGSRELAALTLPAVLSDLSASAGTYRPEHELPEDWAFARVRAQLRDRRQVERQPGVPPPASAGRSSGSKLRLEHDGPLPVAAPACDHTTTDGHPKRPQIGGPRPCRPRREPSRLHQAIPWAAACLVTAGIGLLVSFDRRPYSATGAHVPGAAGSRSSSVELAVITQPLGVTPAEERAPPPRLRPPDPPLAPPATPSVPVDPADGSPPVLPTPAEKPQAPATSTAAEPRTRSAPAIRVFVHHTATSAPDAEAARAFAGELRRAGFTVAGVRPVAFAIRSGSVRYFFDQDRDAARDLAAIHGSSVRGSWPVQDFRHFEPKPRPGTVEIWIESR